MAASDQPVAPRGGWCTGVVREVARPVPDAVLLRLEVPDRVDHLPGQHYVVRLTAEDGYTASRSYSVASAPADPLIELYVGRLADGEVSTYLADVVEVGDELELRGPIGGWFVWRGDRPALGVAGGLGVVPLVAMLRHARDLGREELVRLAVSVRTREALPYRDELRGQTVVTTREVLGDRAAGRLATADLAPLLDPGAEVFVCGSAAFAEAAGELLVGLGVPPDAIRVERFGPSG